MADERLRFFEREDEARAARELCRTGQHAWASVNLHGFDGFYEAQPDHACWVEAWLEAGYAAAPTPPEVRVLSRQWPILCLSCGRYEQRWGPWERWRKHDPRGWEQEHWPEWVTELMRG